MCCEALAEEGSCIIGEELVAEGQRQWLSGVGAVRCTGTSREPKTLHRAAVGVVGWQSSFSSSSP